MLLIIIRNCRKLFFYVHAVRCSPYKRHNLPPFLVQSCVFHLKVKVADSPFIGVVPSSRETISCFICKLDWYTCIIQCRHWLKCENFTQRTIFTYFQFNKYKVQTLPSLDNFNYACILSYKFFLLTIKTFTDFLSIQ